VDQRTTGQTAGAVGRTIELVESFDPGSDDLARKSRELTLGLLNHSAFPFSRHQFSPGHITCTALVAHPREPLVLFIDHHRLRRWLLPGGHVEPEDASLDLAAAREASEETGVQLDSTPAILVGIDVHGIPAKGTEPFHLHHDLIWWFQALSDQVQVPDEAHEVMWAGHSRWDEPDIAESIRRGIARAGLQHG
jgi:8-oxo-dGTP pyrophosphatase MutT (NUDIX family)